MIWIIFIVFFIAGWLVSNQLKKRFRAYQQIPTSSGLSGKEIAEKMLRDHNIHDVSVISVEGELTDHYNPTKRTINLSPEVYHGRHVSAAAVAAHETGHAVQHAEAYSMLQLRTAMVPLVGLSSKLLNVLFIVSIFASALLHLFPWQTILWIVVAAQGAITLFSLVTLPVEFDASNRALAWLQMSRITKGEEHDKAANALKWAAGTYVVSALAAVTTLLYYASMLIGRD